MVESEKNDFLIDGFPRNEVGTGRLVRVHLYIEYNIVCPRVGIGTPYPLSHKRMCSPPPPEPKGEGVAHSPAGEGAGLSQF
jgi:hypothetical protein